VKVLCSVGATWVAVGLTVVLLADSPVTLGRRSKPGASDPAANGTFRAETNLVLLSVSVTDPKKGPVTGLEKENFKVFENKVEQRVVHLSHQDEPIAVGLVFDTSGSMRKKIDKSRMAVADFLKTTNPEDEFFLVEFDNQAHLAVPYTSNTRQIEYQLRAASPHGRTALLDAIYLALQQLHRSSKPRKALIIVSDGGDNCSRYTKEEVRNLVYESDVLIYAMGVFSSLGVNRLSPEEAGGPDLLEDITTETGGHLYTVENIDKLPEAAQKIGIELRNYYVLAYVPATVHRDGKYHKVQVKVAPPTGEHALRVAWRPGYYAPTE